MTILLHKPYKSDRKGGQNTQKFNDVTGLWMTPNIIVIEPTARTKAKKTISHVLLHPATSSKYACVVEELF